MQDFRNLRVWHTAHALTLSVYRATSDFPAGERYGLASQLRRAAASIGANIAEGCGRSSDADTRRCLHIAIGSVCELHNHVLLARDLGLIEESRANGIESELTLVRRMLLRLVARFGTR